LPEKELLVGHSNAGKMIERRNIGKFKNQKIGKLENFQNTHALSAALFAGSIKIVKVKTIEV
jgi:hypothetical protein